MISVIIPNFNGINILKECFSLNYKIFKKFKIDDIIIIDDDSTDASIEYLRNNFQDITVIENVMNVGFSKSCNKAALQAKNDILFFLNNDMIIENFDLSIIKTYFQNQDLFSLTPAIYRKSLERLLNESITTGYFKGGWFSSENVGLVIEEFLPQNGIPILWGCGGASFINAAKFRALNGFDELFSPFYVEDLDLSYRAWKQDWKCLYTDKIKIFHRHQSTIGTYYSKDTIDQINLRNKYLFIWKNLSSRSFFLSHITTLIIKLLTFQINDTRAIIKAILKLPKLLSSKKSLLTAIKSDKDILNQFDSLNAILK